MGQRECLNSVGAETALKIMGKRSSCLEIASHSGSLKHTVFEAYQNRVSYDMGNVDGLILQLFILWYLDYILKGKEPDKGIKHRKCMVL